MIHLSSKFLKEPHPITSTVRAVQLVSRYPKIGQIRKYLDRKMTERLVHAFVTSRLDANNSLLYGLPNSAISKLQRVQNSAVRLVIGAKGCNVNRVRRDELHWLSIKDRITFKILLLTYKSLHGLAPPYITDLLTVYKPSRSLRSSSQIQLIPPRNISNVYYGERAFSTSAPKLWNTLPRDIRNAKSLAIFKKQLKTHLFK